MSNNENESPKVGQIYVRDVWAVRGHFSEFYLIIRATEKTVFYQPCDIEGNLRIRAETGKCLISNARRNIGELLTSEKKQDILQKAAQDGARYDMREYCDKIIRLVQNSSRDTVTVSPEQIGQIKAIYENLMQQKQAQAK
jgi:hypothetical protein